MNVHSEAYYGGTFTGNRAHKCLKAVNVDAICTTLPRVAAEQCPDMEEMTQSVANKYGRALILYAKCQFNSSNTFADEMLVSLHAAQQTIKRQATAPVSPAVCCNCCQDTERSCPVAALCGGSSESSGLSPVHASLTWT